MLDMLTKILEDEKLFELYTSIQDELSEFLISEKNRREKVSEELKEMITLEGDRKRKAIERIMFMVKYYNKYRDICPFMLEEVEREQQLEEINAKSIAVQYSIERDRCMAASDYFNVLLNSKLGRSDIMVTDLQVPVQSDIPNNETESTRTFRPTI